MCCSVPGQHSATPPCAHSSLRESSQEGRTPASPIISAEDLQRHRPAPLDHAVGAVWPTAAALVALVDRLPALQPALLEKAGFGPRGVVGEQRLFRFAGAAALFVGVGVAGLLRIAGLIVNLLEALAAGPHAVPGVGALATAAEASLCARDAGPQVVLGYEPEVLRKRLAVLGVVDYRDGEHGVLVEGAQLAPMTLADLFGAVCDCWLLGRLVGYCCLLG